MADTLHPPLHAQPTVQPSATDQRVPDAVGVAIPEQKLDTMVVEIVTPTDSSCPPSPSKPDSTPDGKLKALKLAVLSRLRQRSEPVWKPSPFAVRPLLGLVLLAVSVGCMFVSLAILLVSNNQPVRQWPIQPTVYLAIAAALANTALGASRYLALPIHFWYRASRGGSIKDLERNWEVGYSLFLALRHNIRMGMAGFATILIAVMIIDGPLLQRATRVDVATRTTQVDLAINLSPEVPTGFSGISSHLQLEQSDISAGVTIGWRDETPIELDMQKCNSTCSVKVLAPAVMKRNCTSNSWLITQEDITDPKATWGTWRIYDPVNDQYHNPLFYIKVRPKNQYYPQGSEIAQIRLGMLNLPSQDAGVNGSYVDTWCDYVPAIAEYDLSISGREVTILGNRPLVAANNTLSYNANLPLDLEQPSTIEMLSLYLNQFVTVNATVVLGPASAGGPWAFDPTPEASAAQLARYLAADTEDNAIVINDPTADIIKSLNELMFRAAVASTNMTNLTSLIDPGLAVAQVPKANQTNTENAYKSDLRWFAGAAALEAAAAFFVLPLFFGWWTLGRAPLLSPLEVALAFDAPLLREANSATGSAGIIGEIGDSYVRYGAVHDMCDGAGIGEVKVDNAAYRLGIGAIHDVQRPTKGMRFEA